MFININGCVIGPSEVESKRDSHYDDLNDLIAKHSFGRHVLQVALVLSPEDKYRARVAQQDNVDTLEKSLLTFGTVNEHVEVVLFVAPNKPIPAKAGFKPPASADEMKARGMEEFFTIVGDHSQRAMNQLHKRFRGNPKWTTMSAVVYVFQRSPEVYSALKSWGILDNIKGEKRVSVSFQDKITALHEDFILLEAHQDTAGHKERISQLKEQRRKDFGDISHGQMMQLWSIASRDGPVWALLNQIISGDITAPLQLKSSSSRRAGQRRAGVKTVKSAANFTNIGGVEDSMLVTLLQQVVSGQTTLQKLNDLCALVKARMRVQTAVLMDVHVSLFEWEEAVKKFPLATHDDFVERWAVALVREGLKARASLPPTFFTELERRLASDTQSMAGPGLVPVVSVRAININECWCALVLHVPS